MKLLLTIARWAIGVICCLVSIGGFASGDMAAAIAVLVFGLLLLPPVTALFFKKNLAFAGAGPEAIVVPALTGNASEKPAKATGILAWFKGWGTAINVALRVDSLVKSFPNIDPKKLQAFIALKTSLGEDEINTLRKRVIDGYDKKITPDNVDALGHAYLELYKSIFTDDDGAVLLKKIAVHQVEAFAFTKIKDDEALDPAETDAIIAFSQQRGVEEYDSVEKVAASYDYYIMNWQLDNGLFAGVAADLILQKNEICLFTLPTVELLEKKSVTTRVGYSGFSSRIKITKGLSYRLGSYNVSSTKEMVDVSKGKGLLNVTTKRILFKNADGVTTINSNAIVDLEPFKDAVIIFKATGKPITIRTADAVSLYKYIRSAMRK